MCIGPKYHSCTILSDNYAGSYKTLVMPLLVFTLGTACALIKRHSGAVRVLRSAG